MLQAISNKIENQRDFIKQEKSKLKDLMVEYKNCLYQLHHPIIKHLTDHLIPDIIKICCEYSSMKLCQDCLETKDVNQCWYPKILKIHPCKIDLQFQFSSIWVTISNNDIISFENDSDQEVWDWIYHVHLKSFTLVKNPLFKTEYGTHYSSQTEIAIENLYLELYDPRFIWYFGGTLSHN